MSLYGGIKFSDGERKLEAESATSHQKPGHPSTSTSVQSSSTHSTSASQSVPEKIKVTPSAAILHLAPRINKPKPAPVKPVTSYAAYAAASAPSTSISAPLTGVAGIVRSAEPVLLNRKEDKRDDEVILGKDGKPLARAPAMLLGANKGGKWKNKSDDATKKRKKKKKRQAPLMHTFDPEEQYDPYRPNDLGEYQEYRKRVREERREKYMENKRRRAAGESSEGSSDYSDSEEDVAPRRDAPKLWAPPKEYNASASGTPPASVPPPPPSAAQSGDDAYARRAALSQQPASGDDAYARRAALSRLPAPLPPSDVPPPPPHPSFRPPSPPPMDSYSPPSPTTSFQPPPPPITLFPAAPPPPGPPVGIPGFTHHRPPQPGPSGRTFVPPPASLIVGAPIYSAPAPPSMPNFAPSLPGQSAAMPNFPPSIPRPPPAMPNFAPSLPNTLTPPTPQSQPVRTTSSPPPPPPRDEAFEAALEEKKKSLAAIAAKFATLPGAKPAPVPFEEVEGESFAEKMMRKWGHKEGQGLGSKQEGITEALSVEHVVAPPKNPSQMSKRQLAKQKMAAANLKTNEKNKKWVQHTLARGKIVNADKEIKQKDEKEKYGEASRVLCLVGVVSDLEEVDEDLSEEIGEECSKYGIVERVVLHMVEPPPEDPVEALRVFVVFSGMAGAWRSLRELDGRFFGGQKIRATYFDETKFDAGDRDGPIL